jgi:hypothetical protein
MCNAVTLVARRLRRTNHGGFFPAINGNFVRTFPLLEFFFYLISSWSLLGSAFGQGADVTLTFAARPPQVLSQDHGTTLTGHAFLIIGLKTSEGIKEDIFGFYPVSGSAKGMIKGPGMLKSEERCGPNDDCGPTHHAELLRRLSEVKESISVPISLEQRNAVYAEIKKWDSKSTIGANGNQVVPSSDAEYRIFDSNCIDFIAAVATRLGYPTPARSSLQTPAEFLTAFKPLAEQEQKVREAARQASESKKRAAAAEEKARAAEEQAGAAEEKARVAEERARQSEVARQRAEEQRRNAEARAEEQRIPVGWVPCTCPQLHGAYGKVVNGVLYHPSNINCP